MSEVTEKLMDLKNLCLPIILFFSTTTLLFAQWVQSNGPLGGEITCLAYSDNNIYAGTYSGGVLVSSDNGLNWISANNGFSDLRSLYFDAIDASGSNVISCVNNAQVWVSTNKGGNWSLVKNIAMKTNSFYPSVAVKENIFYCSINDSVYISTDAGLNWTPVFIGINGARIMSLNKIGNDIYAGMDKGLSISTNNGFNWKILSTDIQNIYSVVKADSALFVFHYKYPGIYMSSDGGRSWIERDNGLNNKNFNFIFSIVYVNGTLFASTGGSGIYRSTDFGQNWTPLNSSSLNSYINDLITVDSTLIVGTDAGVAFSTDDGLNWIYKNSGIKLTRINSIIADGNYTFAGTQGGGIFKSSDGGWNWEVVSKGPEMSNVSTLLLDNNTLYAAAGQNFFESTDYGFSWTNRSTGLGGTWINSAIVSGNSVFKTALNDNNLNWQKLNNGLTSMFTRQFASKGNNLLVATADSGLFEYSNSTQSWHSINGDLWQIAGVFFQGYKYLPIESVAANDSIIFVGRSNGGLYRSKNDGQNWILLDNGLPANALAETMLIKGNEIYAGTSKGVYYSANLGLSWTQSSDGLPNSLISSLAICNSNLLAGMNYGGGGVWIRPLSQIIEVNHLPIEFKLEQNYPNPFNLTSNINYSVPYESKVTITLYDILGRKIETLLDEIIEPGNHSVLFNAKGLSSGIYLYQLRSGGFQTTKKLVLIK